MIKLYGWYSQAAADKGYGVAKYTNIWGHYTVVTGVTRDISGSSYNFPDKKLCGRVVNFIEEVIPESPEEETPSGAAERKILQAIAKQEERVFRRMYKYLIGK